MHIADGAVSLPVAGAAALGAGAIMIYAIKGTKSEEIPQISLLTGAFFAFSLISLPVGPTSVHPLLGGLLGIILKRRAPIAIFVGLLLQALLFRHGGITTLGVNLLLFSLPALLADKIFSALKRHSVFAGAAIAGGGAVAGGVFLLVVLLLATDPIYGSGFLSVVNLLVAGHAPLMVIEGLLTGFAVSLLHRTKPHVLEGGQ